MAPPGRPGGVRRAALALALALPAQLGLSAGETFDPGKTQLLGSGSSQVAPLFSDLLRIFSEVEDGVNMTYDRTGSGTGLKRLLRNESHWAATEGVLRESTYSHFPGIQLLPFAITLVALVFNLLDSAGRVVESLSLGRRTIARIFSFDVQYWDDPEVLRFNAGLSLPHQRIRVAVREDMSGSSEIMTSALVSFGWQDTPGCRRPGALCTSTARMSEVRVGGPDDNYEGAVGTSGIARYVNSNLWTISYAGVAAAPRYNLSTAVIINRAGEPTLAAGIGQSAVAATDHAIHYSEWLTAELADQEGYPLVGFVYLGIWREMQPTRQFEGVEEAYRGVTKDYKQAADLIAQGEPALLHGDNWGWPADHVLHKGHTCAEHVALLNFLHWLYSSEDARGVVAAYGLVPVPQNGANRALQRVWEAQCHGEDHWEHSSLIHVMAPSPTAAWLLHSVAYTFHYSSNALTSTADHDHLGGSQHDILVGTKNDSSSTLLLLGPGDPVPSSEYAAVPIVAVAVALAFSSGVRGLRTPLQLSWPTLCNIASGQITHWHHPDILGGNNQYTRLPHRLIRLAYTPQQLPVLLRHCNLDRLGANVLLAEKTPHTPSQVAAATTQIGTLGLLPIGLVVAYGFSLVYPTISKQYGSVPADPNVVVPTLRGMNWTADLRDYNVPAHHGFYPFFDITWLYVRRHTVTADPAKVRAELHFAHWLAAIGADDGTRDGRQAVEDVLGQGRRHLPGCCLGREVTTVFQTLTVNREAIFRIPDDKAPTWAWIVLGTGGVLCVVLGVVAAHCSTMKTHRRNHHQRLTASAEFERRSCSPRLGLTTPPDIGAHPDLAFRPHPDGRPPRPPPRDRVQPPAAAFGSGQRVTISTAESDMEAGSASPV
eukprot:TRINITY_DN55924_c0_g1_i1.p1 TRINITY_DN55924_c0_g1~~TRINITY_DN55924_c0_g1_i1.p1  ORF type:complete len:880 (+),score=167.80 TRINITY_DN55924_c0_g1_i1:92-2731(+)